ncbi:MAG: DinB family protein [Thermoplasmata archaeon]
MARVSELESLKMWYDYNARARRTYLGTLSKLSPEDLSRGRGASFPSLVDIFTHTLGGLSSWLDRMSTLHNAGGRSKFDAPEPLSLSDVRRLNEVTEKQVDQFFADLTLDDLDRHYLVKKAPPWWEEDFEAPVRETLYHLIEHELQHRGELNALPWQMDVEPPIADWLFDSLPNQE